MGHQMETWQLAVSLSPSIRDCFSVRGRSFLAASCLSPMNCEVARQVSAGEPRHTEAGESATMQHDSGEAALILQCACYEMYVKNGILANAWIYGFLGSRVPRPNPRLGDAVLDAAESFL